MEGRGVLPPWGLNHAALDSLFPQRQSRGHRRSGSMNWPTLIAVGGALATAMLIVLGLADGLAPALLAAGVAVGLGAGIRSARAGQVAAPLPGDDALKVGLARARREHVEAELLLVDCTSIGHRGSTRAASEVRITDAVALTRAEGRLELLVLTPATSGNGANGNGAASSRSSKVADRILKSAGTELPTGVARFPSDGWTLDALLDHARERARLAAPAPAPRRIATRLSPRIQIPERRPTR
jgi:hypothetical protein